MRGIYISYRREDAERQAGRLFDDLSAVFGDNVFMDVAGAENHIGYFRVVLVVIGRRWLSATDSQGKRRLDDPADPVRRATAAALAHHIPVIPVLVDGAALPSAPNLPDALIQLASCNGAELKAAQWNPDVRLLIRNLVPYLTMTLSSATESSVTAPERRPPVAPSAADSPRDASLSVAYEKVGSEPLSSRAFSKLKGLLVGVRGLLKSGHPEPVRLGASAPRACEPNQRFTATLVAYVGDAAASAKAQLQAFGEADDRLVMDIAPAKNRSLKVGAPVTVRLSGEGIEVDPSQVDFEWNGRLNSAVFAARVGANTAQSLILRFHVFVADVPIASIPMALTVRSKEAQAETQEIVERRLPSSAFASYASKDASTVSQRLSTLQRWSPNLDIFQDCLDLRPNAAFQPQLEAQIRARDVFLLFWSRNAAASPWVRWEYHTACETKDLSAILPMPLEDPELAPPPAELADRHLRDRFMVAAYALERVRAESGHA